MKNTCPTCSRVIRQLVPSDGPPVSVSRVFDNGEYDGAYDDEGNRSGRGTMTWTDSAGISRIYEGLWENDEMHDTNATMTWREGRHRYTLSLIHISEPTRPY